jgi:hypothetical protein
MKSRAFALLLCVAVFQLSALAVSAPRLTFSCQKQSSNTALILDVRNNGPDTLPKGTRVYYYYKTSQTAASITGSHVVTSDMHKGAVFSIFLSPAWQTPVVQCGCSLRRIPVERAPNANTRKL